jgi:hypothetical protein
MAGIAMPKLLHVFENVHQNIFASTITALVYICGSSNYNVLKWI